MLCLPDLLHNLMKECVTIIVIYKWILPSGFIEMQEHNKNELTLAFIVFNLSSKQWFIFEEKLISEMVNIFIFLYIWNLGHNCDSLVHPLIHFHRGLQVLQGFGAKSKIVYCKSHPKILPRCLGMSRWY